MEKTVPVFVKPVPAVHIVKSTYNLFEILVAFDGVVEIDPVVKEILGVVSDVEKDPVVPVNDPEIVAFAAQVRLPPT